MYEVVDGAVVLPDPEQAQLDAVHAQVAALDVSGQGVNVAQLRALFPALSRIQLHQHIKALVSAGRLQRRYRAMSALEFFSVVSE